MWMPFFVLLVAVAGCRAIEPIEPAPPLARLPAVEQERIALGQKLFHEKRLSQDGTSACVSCHGPGHAGAEAQATSTGVRDARGTRNAPTVYNTSVRTTWFWDGRAATLEEQARGPLLNPLEMAGSERDIVAFLQNDPGYQAAFERAFGQSDVTFDHVTRALASYERQLVAPSRVDRQLRGEPVLSAGEERGLAKFQACARCHDGPGVGGARLAKLGEENPWPVERSADRGRETVTGDARDRLVFVAPSLRNVGRTAPYFHDGSVATLEEAVRLMGWHQLGERLSDPDVADLVAFLRALDGTPRAELTAEVAP